MNIIKTQTLEARNHHCLFKYDFDKLNFTKKLKNSFNTVCFTEVPLHQIKNITADIKRQIKLKPYGLVFWKAELFNKGASPAIYINSTGSQLKKYLLDDFRKNFEDISRYAELTIEKSEFHKELVQYYSLINIVEPKHDFMWEREWRYTGSFKFRLVDLVGIIAEDSKSFREKCKAEITSEKILADLKRVPIISPEWGYEEMFEELAIKLWNNAGK
ncbi:abortive infection system antitoxin AbiGi family protein [Paenibacillus sp. FSL H7-0357]|uniref:abortive infection system antitoxin AbiGi family protein n=1 Tax=Paenibacillus sp. FSL H7-0357 TaxID=1536774 RepID=UPI0030D39B95